MLKRKTQILLNESYGPHERNVLDIYLTKDHPKAVVLLIHGGGWNMGDKWMYREMQRFLGKNKIASLNMNYRLLKNGATYKEMMEDIQKAENYLFHFMESQNLEFNNYHIMGESAGAHLSLLYAHTHPAHIASAMSFSGPVFFDARPKSNNIKSNIEQDIYRKLAGLKREKNLEILQNGFNDMSPLLHIQSVKTLLFQGGDDSLVNPKYAEIYHQQLQEQSVENKFIFQPSWGHFYRLWPAKRKIIREIILNWIEE